MFAPTINSYKRLVENYWPPVNISWGLEDRLSSIRLIGLPVSNSQATRFEIRIPGADFHPHHALSAILAAGLRGIEKKLAIPLPPTGMRNDKPELLPNISHSSPLAMDFSLQTRPIQWDSSIDPANTITGHFTSYINFQHRKTT